MLIKKASEFVENTTGKAVTTCSVVRHLNTENGCPVDKQVEFDGVTVKLNGVIVDTFTNIVGCVCAYLRDHGEQLEIGYNRDGIVEFKHVSISELRKNPQAYLQMNGTKNGISFVFRFLARYEEIYQALPDVYTKDGELAAMPEDEFCEAYNGYITGINGCNYGLVGEFHLTGNEDDLYRRKKQHDIYTRHETSTGAIAKAKSSNELKMSVAGGLNREFIAANGNKKNASYSNSNAIYLIEF